MKECLQEGSERRFRTRPAPREVRCAHMVSERKRTPAPTRDSAAERPSPHTGPACEGERLRTCTQPRVRGASSRRRLDGSRCMHSLSLLPGIARRHHRHDPGHRHPARSRLTRRRGASGYLDHHRRRLRRLVEESQRADQRVCARPMWESARAKRSVREGHATRPRPPPRQRRLAPTKATPSGSVSVPAAPRLAVLASRFALEAKIEATESTQSGKRTPQQQYNSA